jgi:hypothetical protein
MGQMLGQGLAACAPRRRHGHGHRESQDATNHPSLRDYVRVAGSVALPRDLSFALTISSDLFSINAKG